MHGVYRARGDVNAVIHGHPLYGTALGATDGTLQYMTHDAVLFTDGLGIYDDGPALVTEKGQATRVAEALGHRRAALLRNHGVVVAGEDIRWATLTAITLERAIRFQVTAAALGAPKPISQADAETLRPMKYQEFLLDDYWASWERRVAPAASRRSRLMRVELTLNGAPGRGRGAQRAVLDVLEAAGLTRQALL
jgi:ribulose-5-phosphate 4-epimerase/fuculose-1-phosphate aldolase